MEHLKEELKSKEHELDVIDPEKQLRESSPDLRKGVRAANERPFTREGKNDTETIESHDRMNFLKMAKKRGYNEESDPEEESKSPSKRNRGFGGKSPSKRSGGRSSEGVSPTKSFRSKKSFFEEEGEGISPSKSLRSQKTTKTDKERKIDVGRDSDSFESDPEDPMIHDDQVNLI